MTSEKLIAKDLRIGNWYRWLHEEHETYHQVTLDFLKGQHEYDTDPEDDQFSRGWWSASIPLTPEILETMGFLYLQNACWNYGSMRIYNISDERPKFRITISGHELVILSYVHQLQNFHHLFTGKELEFTL